MDLVYVSQLEGSSCVLCC